MYLVGLHIYIYYNFNKLCFTGNTSNKQHATCGLETWHLQRYLKFIVGILISKTWKQKEPKGRKQRYNDNTKRSILVGNFAKLRVLTARKLSYIHSFPVQKCLLNACSVGTRRPFPLAKGLRMKQSTHLHLVLNLIMRITHSHSSLSSGLVLN